MLLSCSFVHGRSWALSATASEVLCLPDEILEQIALILGEEQNLRLLNHIAKIFNQMSSFG